jgi:outer membrane protein TolC
LRRTIPPRLDLVGSLDLLGSTTTSDQRRADRQARRDRLVAGAIFSLPIPNREARGNLNAARLSSAQALVTLQRLEQQIVVDVDNASGQIVTGRQRITSTSEARVLARESLSAGEERLRAGTGTTFEVLELQERLATAEAAEVRARADYNKAVSEYHRQTGTTLRVHSVSLD